MGAAQGSSSGVPGPTSTIDLPNLSLTIELDEPAHKAGNTFYGRVRIRNTSSTEPVHLDIGERVGATLYPDGTRAGGFIGAIAGLETTVNLAPDTEMTVSFVAGSSRSDDTGMSALPAGNYLLVVPLRTYLDSRIETIVTPPVNLVLHD